MKWYFQMPFSTPDQKGQSIKSKIISAKIHVHYIIGWLAA